MRKIIFIVCQFSPWGLASPEKCLKETPGVILTVGDALAGIAVQTLIYSLCTSRFCSTYVILWVSSVYWGIAARKSVGLNEQVRWRKRIHEHVRCTYLRRWRRSDERRIHDCGMSGVGEREARTKTVVSSPPKSVVHAYRYHRRVTEVGGVCTMVVGSRLTISLYFIPT